MSTGYETEGYTINNAGRRLVVDPITRIEGRMRCEVNINQSECDHQCRLLRHHVSRLEISYKGATRAMRGRSLNVSAASTGVHALASVYAIEDAIGIKVPDNAISSATLCWQRSGATIIWCTSISLPGWTGSMC
ncbi:hypothetical protein ACVXHB_08385 [Escherichia coli]